MFSLEKIECCSINNGELSHAFYDNTLIRESMSLQNIVKFLKIKMAMNHLKWLLEFLKQWQATSNSIIP